MNEITELTRFREAIPDDPAARARVRNRLMSRTLGHEPLPRAPRRTRRRVVIATAAAAVVAAGGLVVVDSLRIGDRPVGASAEAATLLRQAADAASGSTDPVVGPDEYVRVTTVAVQASASDDDIWLEIQTNELFVPGDSAREWVMRQGPRQPYRPEDAELAAEHGREGGTEGYTARAVDGHFILAVPPLEDWESPTHAFLAGLPRDPQRLLDQLRRYGDHPSRDWQALAVIARVLRTGLAPGDLRAALFQAAALIPGVELIEDQANLDGRTGVAVGYDHGPALFGERFEMIFDPDTGTLIGERSVLVDRDLGPLLPIGSAIGWSAVTTDVVPAEDVDAIPADPRD
jgi:hypothetical protein